MFEYVFLGGIFVAALVAGLLAWAGLIGGLQWAQRFPGGVLPYYFYAVFGSNALAVLLSGRSYTGSESGLFEAFTSNPVSAWAIRLTSLLAMLGAIDQLVRFLTSRPLLNDRRLWVAAVFVIFWVTNLIVPAFFAPNTEMPSLSWFYSLFLGVGLLLMTPESAERAMKACRNAMVAYCLVGLLVALIRPDLALQTNYTEGYLPGVPRLSGLAPHAGTLGATAGLAIWCLWTNPLRHKWINRLCLLIVGVTLFLSQTKTVWFIFFLSIPLLLWARGERLSFNRVAASGQVWAGVAGLSTGLILLFVGGVIFMSTDFDRLWAQFAATEEGARLSSMTGRDKIWAIFLAEWERSPWLGYGLPLFDEAHRMQIGMWWANNGHNQFIDALGRTGLVGAAGTAAYFCLLLWLGFKYAKASRGLSAVLVLSLVIRSISDVPISLQSINSESMAHYLLLAVLAMQIGSHKGRWLNR